MYNKERKEINVFIYLCIQVLISGLQLLFETSTLLPRYQNCNVSKQGKNRRDISRKQKNVEEIIEEKPATSAKQHLYLLTAQGLDYHTQQNQKEFLFCIAVLLKFRDKVDIYNSLVEGNREQNSFFQCSLPQSRTAGENKGSGRTKLGSAPKTSCNKCKSQPEHKLGQVGVK